MRNDHPDSRFFSNLNPAYPVNPLVHNRSAPKNRVSLERERPRGPNRRLYFRGTYSRCGARGQTLSGIRSAVPKILLLFLAALANFAAAQTWYWVARPLPAGQSGRTSSPELVVRNADGVELGRSSECRILTQGAQRWIAGRVRLDGDGPFRISLRHSQGKGDTSEILLNDAVSPHPGSYDVVMLLDASHSMRSNDPRDLRKSATRAFRELAGASSRIRRLSLVRFRKEARVLIPPTPPDRIESLDDALDQLRPYSSTDFGPPFEAAADLVREAPGGRAVLFLSDGEPRKDYHDTHRKLADLGCAVYTIGLSEEADHDLLARIAEETGGQYFKAPAAEELEQIFHRIFRILSAPETVAEFGGATGTLRFALDDGMTNPVLTLSDRGDTRRRIRLDGAPLQAAAKRGAHEHPLGDLDPGFHTLDLSPGHRASCVLRAETNLVLDAFAPGRNEPRGRDLVAGFLVRGADEVKNPQLTCELRTPDGERRRLSPESTDFGLHSVRAPAPMAGRYKLIIEFNGTRGGTPVHRRRELVFVRAAEDAPMPAHGTERRPTTGAAPVTAPKSAGLLPVRKLRTSAATAGEPQATFSSEPQQVTLRPPPGAQETVPLKLRINSAAESPPAITADCATEGVELLVTGTPELNRTVELRVTARADEHSAGTKFTGRLNVRHEHNSWDIPVTGQVERPELNAEFQPGTIDAAEDELRAQGTLTLSLSSDGRCEVRIETDNDSPWRASRSRVEVDEDTASVPFEFRVPRPRESSQWQGEIRIQGSGLAPVSVPWRLSWRPPAHADEMLSPDSSLSGASPFPWAWAVWAIAALLVFLLVMTIRGSQRAAFLLVSAILHLIVLFFTLPDSTLKEIADSATRQPQTVAVGKAIEEERVAAETERESSSQSAPSEAKREKTETEENSQPNDHSESLEPEQASSAVTENPETAALQKTPRREKVETEELRDETADAVRKRHQKAEAPAIEAAEAARKPQSAVPEIREVAAAAAQPHNAPETPVNERPAVQTLHAPSSKTATETRDVESQADNTVPRRRADRIRLSSPASAAASAPQTLVAETQPDTARESLDKPTLEARHPSSITDTPQTQASPPAVAKPAPSSSNRKTPKEEESEDLAQSVPKKSAETRRSSSAAPVQGTAFDVPVADPSTRRTAPETGVAHVAVRRDSAQNVPARPRPVSVTGTPRIPRARRAELHIEGATGTDQPNSKDSRPAEQPDAPGTSTAASGPVPSRTAADTAGTRSSTTARSLSEHSRDLGPALAVHNAQKAAKHGTGAAAVHPAGTPAPSSRLPADLLDAPDTKNAPAKKRAGSTPGGGDDPAAARRQPAGNPAREQTAAPPSARRKRALSVAPPRRQSLLEQGELDELSRLGRTSGKTRSTQGRWKRTFPNFKYSGDWDCDRTAMLNLAHQVEQRTGSVLPFESRNVSVDNSELHKAPFLFMSGHNDFVFSDREVEFLRSYLENGGALWINDSTDVDNESFDRAVRRELKRVMPAGKLREIPLEHPIFQAPYDLRQGTAGFRVPPGDKYRQDYHEGLWLDDRLAVVYTRNDYGDGLEIDTRTHALMPSLTDLSASEMQEASVRMGANIALHFVQGESDDPTKTSDQAAQPIRNPVEDRAKQWRNAPAAPLDWCDSTAGWNEPDGWEGPNSLPVADVDETAGRDNFVGVQFHKGSHEFKGWRARATVARKVSATLTDEQVLLLDVVNPMNGGARIAFACTGTNVAYIESEPVFLRPGLNRNIAVDLRKDTFKTEAVKWENRASFPESAEIDRVFILTYPQQSSGALEFGNPRLATPQSAD